MTTKHQATISPDILKNARQLYHASRAAATKSSKSENLDKVWEVLEAIRNEGSRDYSLAEIGRRLERINGPKTQSLRNKQGSDYRNIISAYAEAVSGSTRYVAKTQSNLEQALALITDPSIRAIIRIALDEAKRLKVCWCRRRIDQAAEMSLTQSYSSRPLPELNLCRFEVDQSYIGTWVNSASASTCTEPKD